MRGFLEQHTQNNSLSILQCPRCTSHEIKSADNALCCAGCGTEYPLLKSKYPDFLLPEMREALKAELEFESEVFGHAEYDYEKEDYHQRGAAWMGVKPTDFVLEVGCGCGAWLRRVPAGLRVGLEPSVVLLEHGSGFFGVVGEATHLPFKAETFDHVFFKYSLHHIEDRKSAIREAARVLKHGGMLSLIEPNAAHPHRKLISDPKGWLRNSGLLIKRIGPVETFQTVQEVTDWAQRVGLTIEKVQYLASDYREQSVRQRMQRIYEKLFKYLLPDEYLYPNYAVQFKKPCSKIIE